MLASMETYLRGARHQLRRWALDPRVQSGGRILAYGGSGFFLSAASLGNSAQPLAMGLICSLTGWPALTVALGGILGFRIFWGEAGSQGMIWSLAGLLLSLAVGRRQEDRDQPLLIPFLAAFLVAATGLFFQVLRQDDTPILTYFTRIALAAGSALLFAQLRRRRDGLARWLGGAVAVLALAQAAPLPFLNLGCIAAGLMAVGTAFPAAALAGLGLDLARITGLPMTAVMCMAYFLRLVPFENRYLHYCAPGAACLGVMVLTGVWDIKLLPGLLAGGALGILLPPRPESIHRHGETGVLQVRLELAAEVMAQTRELLLESAPPPIDERALVKRAWDQACGTCTARKTCTEQEKLTVASLRYPLQFTCRKPGRILSELRRSQDYLRRIKADRQRRREYQLALVQQYQFLSDYLRSLSDQLPRRGERVKASYRLEISARSSGKEGVNGDRCAAFPGTGCRYFVLLCDGMGTGVGAAREGQSAADLLRQMLTAGFPAEHAFRSLNSLLALRGQAGAVTLDLAEIRLDTGRAVLYKWGAAPSWLIKRTGIEKIGAATPPPGLSLSNSRELTVRLSLCRGETLVLLSDGVPEEAVSRGDFTPDAPPGEVARQILERAPGKEDDATAAVIRLRTADAGV